LGAEQAGPSIAIEVRPRPHVGQWGRDVGLERQDIARLTDGPLFHGVDQLERANPRLPDVHVGIAQPRVGAQERGQGEGHLGRVESLLWRTLALLGVRLADPDERHSYPILMEIAVEAADLE